jgi:hypothetical protein
MDGMIQRLMDGEMAGPSAVRLLNLGMKIKD